MDAFPVLVDLMLSQNSSFMRAQVVGDDVDFFFFGLAGNDLIKEFDELDAGMPGAGFAEHFPGARVKRSVQRKGAILWPLTKSV
jgi:hypothetical protein